MTKHQYEHKIAEGHSYRTVWEEYFDTNDPYKLIEEAREARALLDTGFVSGTEFALGVDEDGDATGTTVDFAHPHIKYVCSIGAVFRIQGHHVYDCNLLGQLGRSVVAMTPEHDRPDVEDYANSDYAELVVDVNDTHGKHAALDVFDHTIATYQAQIDYAESMAAQYMGAQSVSAPFRIGPHYKPKNYGCGLDGCTPVPIESEVNA